MVANLLQNPSSFPLCNVYLPTLLRRGEMYLLSNRDDVEERMMLSEAWVRIRNPCQPM